MMPANVRGVNAVVRNIESLDEKIKDGARKARLRAAFEIEREAVVRVPVDTGRLKGSIMTQEVSADTIEVGSGVKAGSEVEYAHKVEFGTSKQAARPFLQPAVELVKIRYPNMIIEDVQAEIR